MVTVTPFTVAVAVKVTEPPVDEVLGDTTVVANPAAVLVSEARLKVRLLSAVEKFTRVYATAAPAASVSTALAVNTPVPVTSYTRASELLYTNKVIVGLEVVAVDELEELELPLAVPEAPPPPPHAGRKNSNEIAHTANNPRSTLFIAQPPYQPTPWE
ncbi:MAG: hypothetical protein ACT4NV_02155 [Rhodoferax sp.]